MGSDLLACSGVKGPETFNYSLGLEHCQGFTTSAWVLWCSGSMFQVGWGFVGHVFDLGFCGGFSAIKEELLQMLMYEALLIAFFYSFYL